MVTNSYHQQRAGAPAAPQGCPVNHAWSPLDDDYLDDPYPIARGLGDDAPVFFAESLNLVVVSRMEDIAACLMRGLEYGEGFFNVEFMVDFEDKSVQIIEVNPRLASQFADLYEKVDGLNSYDILLDLALGKSPERKKGAGTHRMAASCALRRFQDAWVRELPSEKSLERLKTRFPDLRIEVLAEQGQLLSRCMQDGCSFRYAVINIGGADREDILQTLAECIKELNFDFADVRAPGKQATGG